MLTVAQLSFVIIQFSLESERQYCLPSEPQSECRRQYPVQTRGHNSPFDPHLTPQGGRYKYISHSWKQSGTSRLPKPIFGEEIHLTNTNNSHLFHYFVSAFHLSMWRPWRPRILSGCVYVRLQQTLQHNKIAYYSWFLIPYTSSSPHLLPFCSVCNIPSRNISK